MIISRMESMSPPGVSSSMTMADAPESVASSIPSMIYSAVTGLMELQLDRKLAERRIWPAISIPKSGTRKEELLVDPWKLPKLHMLRRFLSTLSVDEEMPQLLRALEKFPSNDEFLRQLDVRG